MNIDLDAIFELVITSGRTLWSIYRYFNVTIWGHTYNLITALLAIGIFWWLYDTFIFRQKEEKDDDE